MAAYTIDHLKTLIRERDIPFFTDEDLEFYLAENNGDVYAAAYQCLNIKAENTQLQLSGLTMADTSSYFRRLAAQYRPSNSGILRG